MTPARFLGKLGMTFFLVDYGYLCATAYFPASPMSFATSIGSVRALVLSLVLFSAGPVLAQQTTTKAKNTKVKIKTSAAISSPASDR